MVKTMGQSNRQQAPLYTRYHQYIIGGLQKKQKGRGDTFRLCIGYTHITHLHLKKEDTPIYVQCAKVLLTVKLILLNCNSFRQTRPKYNQTSTLKDFFKNTKPEDILSFLFKKNLFIKI